MTVSCSHCRAKSSFSGTQGVFALRAGIIDARRSSGMQTLRIAPAQDLADRFEKALPKRWYNVDVVLTDDFPRG